MTDYNKTAIGEIRDFLWKNLKQDGILKESDYIADGFTRSLVPIIPTQQVPEFNNLMSGKTYIVYDFNIYSYGEDYWICEENASFMIVSSDYGKIVQIINYMVDLFRRMDDAAKDLNIEYMGNTPFKYHLFYIDGVEGPQPTEEEGGNMIGTVDVTFKYSREIGPNGRFL